MIAFTHDVGGCSIDHLHAIFWAAASRVACYRRIGKLVAAGYLDAARTPSLSGVGSGKYLFTLGREGRKLLAELRGIPVGQLRQRRLVSPQQVDHHFSVVSFRVNLTLACQVHRAATLSRWVSEPCSRRASLRVDDTYPHGSATRSRVISLAPDAVFTLVPGLQHQDFFLELDRATISAASSRLLLKLRGYLRYQQHRPIPVLYVVPNHDRMQHLFQLVLSQAKELHVDPRRILVTTQHQLSPHTILTAPIWHQPGVTSSVTLLPADPKTKVRS